jgi:cyclohexanone monooxygenase
MVEETTCDALVVGAGLAGIYQTYELRQLGLRTICLDRAPEVGGTWYWNRYPGAMSDTESYLYRYSWDKEDLRSWPWQTRYLYQPEILEYINHIVDKHGLRDHLRLSTSMEMATWEEQTQRWRVRCDTGVTFNTRYLVNALGLLTSINWPNIPGLKSFEGDLIHTATWPSHDLQLCQKRVGVIGNGSTGIQVMTALAPKVKHLTSFQRHPQYSVPSGQRRLSDEERQKINQRYDDIYDSVWASAHGHGIPEATQSAMSVDPDERQRRFQEQWDMGNAFRFMFSSFGDIATNVESNRAACEFIKSKIRQTVKDPKKASALIPTELYARRPLCDTGYYQIFNYDHVDVINVLDNAIERIMPDGILLSDGTVVKIDMLIMATGFDAMEGSYLRVCIRGRQKKTLQDHWRSGATAYMGVACSGFPNMFLVSGPQGPFANFPCAIEAEVNFITACIKRAESAAQGKPAYVEVAASKEQAWSDLCDQLTEGSLFKTTKSWIFGENIEGRKPRVKFFFSGLAAYLNKTGQETQADFPAFSFSTSAEGPSIRATAHDREKA